MEVKEVKSGLGKIVVYESDLFYGKPKRYIFNAYIFRVDPRDKTKRLAQAELIDVDDENSILVTNLHEIVLESELFFSIRKCSKK